MMKIFLIVNLSFIVLFINCIYAQEGKEYTSFEDAFQNPENVYSLKIDPVNNTKKVINGISLITNIGIRDVKSIPNDILKLKNLKKLYFINCKFEEFPKIIFELENLEFLGIDCCNLKEIPIRIAKLKKLKQLNLYNNRLTTLPVCIGELSKLRWLGINGNLITSFPLEIGKLRNLECFQNGYNYKNKYNCIIPDTILSIDRDRKSTRLNSSH